MADTLSLAQILRAKRGHLGIRAMARQLGVSPTTLSRLERGKEPDPKSAAKILSVIQFCPTCMRWSRSSRDSNGEQEG